MTFLTTRQKRGKKAHRLGTHAETLCYIILWLKCYRILAQRYKTKQGEIDIVAARGRNIIFVEVKARPDHEQAAGAISPQQQTRLARAGQAFLAHHPQYNDYNLRFDAMLVTPWRWPQHIENAF